jgi:hypothetical protein
MNDWLVSALGFCGAGLVLLGYLQVSRGQWDGKSMAFQLANFVGASMLLVYSLLLFAYANVLLNLVWLAVAVVAIRKMTRRARK